MDPESGSTSRFVQWSNSSDSSSDSDDSKSTRTNTVEITNLHPKTTHAQLLLFLMRVGPLGKIYSVHVRNTKTDGMIGTTALVAFFQKESCYFLVSFAKYQGILVMDRRINVSLSKEKAPETIEPQGRDDSRVLLLEGKNEIPTPDNFLRMFATHKVRESHIQMKELIWKTATTSKVAVAFTSYNDACRMLKAVYNGYEPDDLRASYGRDPMESGVKNYADTAQPTLNGHPHGLKVKIDWESKS